MDLDILSPEFIELAQKAQELFEKREAATQGFKELWIKHKEELAGYDQQAIAIKEKYARALAAAKKKASAVKKEEG